MRFYRRVLFVVTGAPHAHARTDMSQVTCGAFLASGCNDGASPPPPRVIHCRTGNLLRALLGFGWYNEYAYNGKTWVDFDPQG